MREVTLGAPVLRREDAALIRGLGRYVADIAPPGLLHAAFVRSPLAHAAVTEVDCEYALSLPGVVGIFGPGDLAMTPVVPWGVSETLGRTPLTSTVRYVGDPVAIVLAESEVVAREAASAVDVGYDELPAVVDVEAAAHPTAPVIFGEHGTNIALEETFGAVDPMVGADVVVSQRLVNQRLAPVPLEPNAILAVPEPDGSLTVWLSSQDVFTARSDIASAVGMDADSVRVIAPDVGGGFGAKGDIYAEHVAVVAASRRLGRPVRWIESRSENLVNMVHGRAQVQYVRIGAKSDGTVVGIDLDIVADVGAYPGVAAWLPRYTAEMASGCYRFQAARVRFRSVVTNTTPVGPYRGAGRPEAIQAVERMMDLLARRMHMDPTALRRMNLIPPFSTPLTTATGARYDSGDYEATLDRALAASGYHGWIVERDRRRGDRSRLQLGVGVGCYVEVTVGKTPPREYALVAVSDDGTVTVHAGGVSHGQGHATALSQIAAARFRVPIEQVQVVQGDTGLVRRGGGTYASRTIQLAGSSVLEASDEVIARGRRILSYLLEAPVEDVELVPGQGLAVRGAPHTLATWGDLARLAATDVPEHLRGPLRAESNRAQPGSTYPFGTHVAVVELDSDTGWLRLVAHTGVDDCGQVVNPLLAGGQQHGGIAQGVGQALFEHVRFDDAGQPLGTSLMTYFIPAATDLPSFTIDRTATPTPLNPLGAKGIGEAGTLGSTPAIHSAAMDALAPFGVDHLDLPLASERVWRSMIGGMAS